MAFDSVITNPSSSSVGMPVIGFSATYSAGRGRAIGTSCRSYPRPSSASRNLTFRAFEETGLS